MWLTLFEIVDRRSRIGTRLQGHFTVGQSGGLTEVKMVQPSGTGVSQSNESECHHQQYRRGHASRGSALASAMSEALGWLGVKMRTDDGSFISWLIWSWFLESEYAGSRSHHGSVDPPRRGA